MESQHTEWKESWRDDHLRWICGFANAEGGRLEIGRNDKGDIVGLADAPKLLEDLPNRIRDLLGILVAVNLHHADGKPWLVIEVDSYPNPISYRSHYYIRSGSTLQELKGAALDRFLLRKQGRTWDGVPVPKVKTTDLSAPAIRKFREMAARSGRLDPADLRVPDAALVEKLKLTEGNYLKRAALILFHDDPERFVTGAFVKIGYFRSASDLAYHDEVHGDLFEQSGPSTSSAPSISRPPSLTRASSGSNATPCRMSRCARPSSTRWSIGTTPSARPCRSASMKTA